MTGSRRSTIPSDAAGDHRIVALECGNYGEDELAAWRLDDAHGGGVVLVLRSTGTVWCLEQGDVLVVQADGFVGRNMIGMETFLSLRKQEDELVAITHFECTLSWGGPHDDDVATFARRIAEEAGCTVDHRERRVRGSA